MKKISILSIAVVFFLSIMANSAFAGRGYSHGGHGYGHGGYNYNYGHGGHYYHHDDHYWGWDAFAIGLGTAVIGSAIINSIERAPAPVVEKHIYYNSYAPPEYRDDYCPNSCPPERVWIPGRYIYTGDGHYVYDPGHWAQ